MVASLIIVAKKARRMAFSAEADFVVWILAITA